MTQQTKLNKIAAFLDRFFGTVHATNCEPDPAEYINGQAFTYKTHKLTLGPVYVVPTNTITATLHRGDGGVESYTEQINQSGVIDAVSIFRSKEAFGMTEVVGAAFGKLKETKDDPSKPTTSQQPYRAPR